jgi:hypothetical protein
MIVQTSSSFSISVKTSSSSSVMSSLIAFNRSGRLSVTVAMRSRFSSRIVV